MGSNSKFRFNNLDSIRTVAFLSTFMAHAFYTESSEVSGSSVFQWAVRFRDIFSFGVPIFFVLSGFLITFLMLREQEKTSSFSLKNFYIRRVLRIWPVYYLVIFIGFVLFPIVRGQMLGDPYVETANPWMYAGFLSNFDQMANVELPYGVGLGPTWSVSVEEQFYLFWPLLFLFFKGRKFIYPLLIVLFGAFFLTVFFGLSNKHLVSCMVYLSMGGVFGYAAMYYQSIIEKITHVHPVYFLGAVGITLWFIHLSLTVWFGVVFSILIAAAIGYMIVYQCYSGRFQLKSVPFLENLGKFTYGLYLYHVICNFIAHVFIDDVVNWEDSVTTAVFVKPLISLMLSVVLSYFSYRYFEHFFLKLKTKYSTT